MKYLITFAAIVVSMGSPIAQSIATRQTFVLDLTNPDIVRTSGPIASEGRVTSSKPKNLDLEVRLAKMSRTEFRIGDGFVFEIEVKNIGRSPIDFPRSVDLASFVPSVANSTARIYLQTRRRDGRAITFGTTMLAGSEAETGSLQRLVPSYGMVYFSSESHRYCVVVLDA